MAAAQPLLFDVECLCGTGRVEKAGLCLPCYRRRWHSIHRFGGHRDEVLERDGYRCRVCGRVTSIVHHRGQVQEASRMITLCARCHAPVHHLMSIRRWVPDLLLVLWHEQHPRQPLQMQFPLLPPVATNTNILLVRNAE